MGKGILFLVLASAYLLAEYKSSETETFIATEVIRTEYMESVLSRELAHSAFNLVVSKITQDFADFRIAESEQAFGDGMYAMSASGVRQGPVQISAYGEVGGSIHLIEATMERFGSPILDALTIDGPVSSVTVRGNSFVISGLDAPANEDDVSVRPGIDGHAIRTVLSSSATTFQEAIDAHLVPGRMGEADVISGPVGVDLDELEESILAHEDLILLEGSQRITGNQVYGSPEEPVLLRVSGDLNIRGGLQGYGVLLVDGSFSNSGNFRWEGLVLLSSSGGDHEFKGTADIYGGLVVRSQTADGESGGYEEAGLPNGHFDVDVFTSTTELLYHQHQFDDRYDVGSLDLLSAGCEVNGGLCWTKQVTEKGLDKVRITLENTDSTTGTFSIQTGSGLNSGPISSGLSSEVLTSELEAFTISFTEACEIAGTSPGDVWADSASRDGQLTVKVFDFTPEASGNDPILIHEVVVYRHSTSATCDALDHDLVNVEPISFYINGDVGIHLSTSALAKLESLLPIMEAPPIEIKMTEVRQNSN
ncbi:hypothetical protein HQ496_14360 [bacterium]|nr:hypothetical protein [bacterium]